LCIQSSKPNIYDILPQETPMLSWIEFVKKYTLQNNHLYDTALEMTECVEAYNKYKEELREKHRARIQAMQQKVQTNIDAVRKERHRARIQAMQTKVEELVQQNKPTQPTQQNNLIECPTGISIPNEEITCRTPTPPIVAAAPTPAPAANRILAFRRHRQPNTMVFT